ncbi:MAG: hypothetical protein KJI70_00670 [Patescibacteria group bacterium]|nr:hypothetical protein [Patescibacteria group bacterium]
MTNKRRKITIDLVIYLQFKRDQKRLVKIKDYVGKIKNILDRWDKGKGRRKITITDY